VNNAGLARHRRIVDYTEAEIDLMLAVNLKGVILGSQAAMRVMAPRRRATSSTSRQRPAARRADRRPSIAQRSGVCADSPGIAGGGGGE
jgi:NAD(P)-dependent dehydrogenase (short-subunit alcohol dehydrogenase family)